MRLHLQKMVHSYWLSFTIKIRHLLVHMLMQSMISKQVQYKFNFGKANHHQISKKNVTVMRTKMKASKQNQMILNRLITLHTLNLKNMNLVSRIQHKTLMKMEVMPAIPEKDLQMNQKILQRKNRKVGEATFGVG